MSTFSYLDHVQGNLSRFTMGPLYLLHTFSYIVHNTVGYIVQCTYRYNLQCTDHFNLHS